MPKPKHKLTRIGMLVAIMGALYAPATALAADNCSDPSQSGLQKCLQHNPIVNDLNVIVNFLSAGVGIVVVGVIILGGIQYSLAGDSADAVGKAKQRITNGLLALLAYLLIFGFLQWIVPGGLFNP